MKRLLLVTVAFALGAVLALGVRVGAQSGDDGRYVMIGVILYDKTTGQEVYVYNGTGWSTTTPSATLAPTVVDATHTPIPPTATLTPSATPPAPVDPTPTPEATALPTLPPDGHDKLCLVKVGASAVNERTAPSTSAPKTATSPVPAASPVKQIGRAHV